MLSAYVQMWLDVARGLHEMGVLPFRRLILHWLACRSRQGMTSLQQHCSTATLMPQSAPHHGRSVCELSSVASPQMPTSSITAAMRRKQRSSARLNPPPHPHTGEIRSLDHCRCSPRHDYTYSAESPLLLGPCAHATSGTWLWDMFMAFVTRTTGTMHCNPLLVRRLSIKPF